MTEQHDPWWRPPYDMRVVWALLPIGLIALGFGVMPLKSWDYYWHIAFGRMIASTGEMPVHAHWLYTMAADAPAYVQPWLAQRALFWIHETFGLHTVLLLRNFLAMAAYGALGLWAARRAGSHAVGAILVLVISAFGFFTIEARSHLLAWPLFLVVLPLAYGLRAGRVHRAVLLAFPLITALWANLHGTFPVVPVVCAAFTAAEFVDMWRRRSGARNDAPRGPTWLLWTLTCAASLFATLANPRAHEVWWYLWMMSTNRELRETVTEWWPILPWSPPWFGPLFWVMLIFALWLMFKNRTRLDFADLFTILWIAILALPQARFMMWFAFAYPIVVAPYLDGLARHFPIDPQPSRMAQVLHVTLGVGLVLIGLAVQPWTDTHPIAADVQAAPARTEAPELGLAQSDAPYEAISLIQQHFTRTPRMYHDHRYPGFLIYYLNVAAYDQVVFADNRVELLPYELWREFDRIGRAQDWQARLDEYEVDAVVTTYQTHPLLVAALKDSAVWECPFDNDHYVVCWRTRPLRTPTR